MSLIAPVKLAREQAQLLVIDIQEKLLPYIHDHGRVTVQSVRAIRMARELELPITQSEQYPQGLGPTTAEVRDALGDGITKCEKLTFSFCADARCRLHLESQKRPQILLIGIEAHVCVQQTALELLEMGLQPVVLADAAGSRRPLDYSVALELMRHAGVMVTTVESALFQLVRSSGTEMFKRILPLAK